MKSSFSEHKRLILYLNTTLYLIIIYEMRCLFSVSCSCLIIIMYIDFVINFFKEYFLKWSVCLNKYQIKKFHRYCIIKNIYNMGMVSCRSSVLRWFHHFYFIFSQVYSSFTAVYNDFWCNHWITWMPSNKGHFTLDSHQPE